MHPDRIKGVWKKFKGNVLQLWGKITFDQFDVTIGKGRYLIGQIQESHGIYMEDLWKQEIVKVLNKEEIESMPITPGIEHFLSSSLESFTGSYKAISDK